MTSNDYAVIVSTFSASISLFSLGWNVWSKFIYPKGKLKTTFAFTTLIFPGTRPAETYLTIGVINFGPTDLRISTVAVGFK